MTTQGTRPRSSGETRRRVDDSSGTERQPVLPVRDGGRGVVQSFGIHKYRPTGAFLVPPQVARHHPCFNKVRERILEELTCSFFNPTIAMATSSMCRDVRQANTMQQSSDGRPRLKVSRKTETMGSARNNAKTLKKSDKWRLTPESSAVEENVQAIKRWERAILLARSKADKSTEDDMAKKTPKRSVTKRARHPHANVI